MISKSKKSEIVDELKSLAKQYQTIGIINMSKIPARQLLKIKNLISDRVKIRMTRKALMVRSLKEAGFDNVANKIDEMTEGSLALIFSNEEPFKLFQILKKSRATAAARVGSIVSKDIVIKKGPTSISPGPAITTLQKVGLKTRVEGGKISVVEDKIVLKAGGVITEDLAGVLNMLKIEPIEIGLKLIMACYKNEIFPHNVLDVNVEQYMADIEHAAIEAVNLSINTGYPTKMTVELMLSKAFIEAKSLGVELGIIEKETLPEIISKAAREALSLSEVVKI